MSCWARLRAHSRNGPSLCPPAPLGPVLLYLTKGCSCLNISRGLFSFKGRGAAFRASQDDAGLMEAPSPGFQIPSRCGEFDVAAAFRQLFPGHCLDDWPVLPNELRRILKILRLHYDSAGLPASATRYLEIECVTRGLRIFPMRLNIPAHASPRIALNWDILGLQICPSCDANVAWAEPMSRP